MTNYQPTRADQLRAGDVVRDPYFDHDVTIITAGPASAGSKWTEITVDVDGVVGVFRHDVKFDKRITDEEYERLSAPEDW